MEGNFINQLLKFFAVCLMTSLLSAGCSQNNESDYEFVDLTRLVEPDVPADDVLRKSRDPWLLVRDYLGKRIVTEGYLVTDQYGPRLLQADKIESYHPRLPLLGPDRFETGETAQEIRRSIRKSGCDGSIVRVAGRIVKDKDLFLRLTDVAYIVSVSDGTVCYSKTR